MSLGSRRRRVAAALIVHLVSLVAMLGPAEPAQAHAIIDRTVPGIDETVDEPPARIVMVFNEPVEVSFGGIRVFDTTGERVDDGETEHLPDRADEIEVPLEPDLEGGTYTVAWRIVSADGHPISGAFVFHVGAPGLHPEGIAAKVLNSEKESTRLAGSLFGAARWVNFVALLIMVGASLFVGAIWFRTPASLRAGETGSVFSTRLGRVLVSAWTTLLVVTIAGFALQGAVAGGFPLGRALSPGVIGDVIETRFGIVSLVKLVLLVLVAIFWKVDFKPALQGLRHQSAGAAAAPVVAYPLGATTTFVIGAVLGVALLSTPGLAGHAGTTPPVALNLAADALHLVAGAAWIGGLFVLLAIAFPAVKRLPEDQAVQALGPVVARFSDMAMIAVAVIVLTGVYRTWMEVGAWRAFVEATYGWVLLAKVAVFLPLLALGAINNRWTKPLIERAADRDGSSAGSAFKMLKRLIAGEVVLAIVVLGLTAALVNLPPARVEAGVSGPFIKDVSLGDYKLNIVVQPNVIGQNEVHLTATTATGTPAPIKAMTVLFRMPEEEIGPLEGEGRRLAPGHFVVQGRHLSVPGTWQLEIVVRTGPFDDERTTVSVEVND